MRKVLLAAAIALSIVPGATLAQQRAANCQELRAACEKKGQLGEQGEGNCRRYRQQCGQPQQRQQMTREQYCYQLRQGCLEKERLGEQGAGNCQRYRTECRGR